jgi:X-linked retinitis pigmentosa GTPase regulator
MASGYTEIFAWGGDHFGQLGLAGKDTGKSYCIPRFCSFNVLIKQISCGEEHSGFITTEGIVYTIGNNADGRLGVGDKTIKYSSSPCLVEVSTRIPAA